MKKETEIQFYLSSESLFSDFFRKNYKIACLIALRYVKDHQVAEDLVQDVFVALWEKKETVNVHTNLRTYFFTAVRNHAINLVQRNKSMTTSLSQLFIDPCDELDSDSFDQEILALKIYNAIEELPQACQAVFRLAYQQNYSYQQIADTLQISKNTVKTHMGIAYKHLRTKLKHLVITFLHFLQK